MSWIAAGAAVIGTGLSVGGAAGVGGPKAPKAPNSAQAARTTAGAQADAALLERQLASREQLGQGVPAGSKPSTMNRGQLETLYRKLSKSKDPADRAQALIIGPLATAAKQTGKPQTVYTDPNGKYISGEDFTGQSTADIQGGLARQAADQSIALGAKYGVDEAKQRADEAALADPQGTAARKAEYDLIENQINNPTPINPLAGQLDSQIDAQVKAGSGLDDSSRQLLEEAVTRANAARGGNLAAGDVATSMSTGAEGQARMQAAEDKAGQWLASGKTPAEIQREREQLFLSDLGSFVSGRTPEDQFRSISTAANGSTPYYPGQPAPTQPNNASTIGPNAAAQSYADQVNAAKGQTSWLTALGGLFTKGAGLAAGGG